VREADLARHLEDKKGAAPAEATPRSDAPVAPAPAVPAVPQRRYEFGSAEDFQLRQALNHLQGKAVDVAKSRDSVAKASAAAK